MDNITVPGISATPVHYRVKAGKQKQIHFQIGSFEDVRPGALEIVLELILDTPMTELHLTGTSITHPGQQHSITTIQKHTASETMSSVIIRSIVYQESLHTYHSVINLEPESFGASAQQENKIVVLGQAQVISEPTLIITHNQVTCSHGTAIGQLDADQLLYLQLRGFEQEAAKKLLIISFIL